MAKRRIVIVGGGFGGMRVARELRRQAVDITLVDRRNFHLFQPLLYQVATGGLSPANIATPLRSIFRRQHNARVLKAEVSGFDVENHRVLIDGDAIPYDTLIVATGSTHHYFGNDHWEARAPGLKTVEDALHIRRRVLESFEQAELENDLQKRRALLTFVIVGGGPTGVELAGALGEMSRYTLRGEFRAIDPAESRIVLCEASPRILSQYPEELSQRAKRSLERLGVAIWQGTRVEQIESNSITVSRGADTETLDCHTVLWGAGVRASSLGPKLARATGTDTDDIGRVLVEPNLTVKNHPDIFVLGDLARLDDEDGHPLPGVAQVAIQQGKYVGDLLRRRLRGKNPPGPFRYRDLGNMAVIGRSAAVAELGRLKFSGFVAWITWLFVHLINLVAYQNRLLVLIQWGWNYTTRNRSARLITKEQKLSDE